MTNWRRTASTMVAAAVLVLVGIGVRSTQVGPQGQAQSVVSGPYRGATGATGSQGTPGTSGILTGTTGSIGGGLLSAAACTSGTATVTGATVGMVATADPATYPGDGAQWQAYVSSANTVTVKVCVLLLLTPVATTYAVRVVP